MTVKKVENFLTEKALNIILDLAKKISKITNYTLLLLLASTGMRKGEAHALKWNNINYRKKL